MDDALRTSLEHAAIGGCTFEPVPRWHFLFLENRDILRDLLALLPEHTADETMTDAIAAFSGPSPAAAADACAGLNRMFSVAKEQGKNCRFSDTFLQIFSGTHAEELMEAFGVPAGYFCTGAIVFDGEEAARGDETPRWDVFSYMK